MNKSVISLISLTLILVSNVCFSEGLDTTEPSDLGKYVSINIEIKELKESGVILRDASQKLSTALDGISDNLHELSPEQLRQVNDLAEKVDSMTSKLNQAIQAVPTTIKNAQKPSNELLQQSLTTIRAETVTPIVSSINRWLIITIIGICVLGVGLLAAFIIISKKASDVGSSVIKIAEGYRVIPLEQYNESRVSETNPDNQRAATQNADIKKPD